MRKSKSIFLIFPGYSKEKIASAVSKLPEKYKSIVYKKFGKNLDEINHISHLENSIFHETIKKHIFALLEGKSINIKYHNKTIFEYIPGYSKEELLLAISKLSEKYQDIVRR